MGLRLIAIAVLLAACSTAPATSSSPTATASPIARATEVPSPTPTPTPAPTPTAPPNWDSVPAAATDPVALAQQLAMVEAAIRDPNVTGAQLDWMGHLQQLAYSRLQDYPEWRDSVLGALPEQARASALGSLEAGRQVRMLSGPVPKTLPDWLIVQPKPVDQLMSFYKEAETKFGIPWYYLAAVHLVESRMGRIRGLSSAGAQGPMQFIPSTWAQYGTGDINDDHDSILAAARYLKAAGGPADMQRALFAYNHAQAYVNGLIDYATVMKNDPLAYRGYHGWQVYYPTADGPILLPIGWTKPSN